jgi:hypothetical protein
VFSADAEGYIASKLFSAYQPLVRAVPDAGSGPTVVHLGVTDLQITTLDIANSYFTAIFWLKVSWFDRRYVSKGEGRVHTGKRVS